MRVQIFGKGKVGYSFYRFLKDRGVIVEIFSRREGGRLMEDGDVLFIATKDKEIKEVAEKLMNLKFKVFAHFSGALSSEILPEDKERASFHPLQAFSEANPVLWKGITVVCEGTDGALKVLKTLSHNLGLKFKVINSEVKVVYHAAAVILSNFIYAPILSAESLFKSAGLGKEDFAPLLMSSVENYIKYGKGGLTGPIPRKDFQTLEMHIKALKGDNLKLYLCLKDFLLKIFSKDA